MTGVQVNTYPPNSGTVGKRFTATWSDPASAVPNYDATYWLQIYGPEYRDYLTSSRSYEVGNGVPDSSVYGYPMPNDSLSAGSYEMAVWSFQGPLFFGLPGPYYPSNISGQDTDGYFASSGAGYPTTFASSGVAPRAAAVRRPGISRAGRPSGPTLSPQVLRTNEFQLMVMDADGNNLENIPQVNGWDPTWSPDGKRILFASDRDGATQLFTVNLQGKQLSRVTNLPAIRGRSDWSPDGEYIVTYSGEAWNREVYLMNADGSNVRQLTPSGGNSQGAAFSPDGRWVVFTAYFDHPGDDHGCEINIIRTDGTDLRRLTDNDYCDYQPRWGP